jgi:dihydrofolate reductase
MNRIILIYATGLGGQFCHENKLPWKCKEDLDYLYSCIKGKHVLVTNTTAATMPKAFINKKQLEKNITLLDTRLLQIAGSEYVITDNTFLNKAKEEIEKIHAAGKDVWVIGGRSLYTTLLSHNLFTDIIHCVINYNGPGDCFAYKDRYQFESTLGCKMVSGIKLYSQSQIMEPKIEPFLNCQALERFHYTKILDNKLNISLA